MLACSGFNLIFTPSFLLAALSFSSFSPYVVVVVVVVVAFLAIFPWPPGSGS